MSTLTTPTATAGPGPACADEKAAVVNAQGLVTDTRLDATAASDAVPLKVADRDDKRTNYLDAIDTAADALATLQR